MRYEPQVDAEAVPHVVVDGSPTATTVLTLSHWPGSTAPPDVEADTSAEMVLRYVDGGRGRHGAARVATNNHFDQDGTAGLYALTDPDGALHRRALVADLARAGDFATYRHRTAARASMALAAMAADAPPGPYPERCAALYTEALGMLPELLDHPDRFRSLWADEDAELTAGEAAVAAGRVDVREVPELDLAVITLDPSLRPSGGHRFASDHAEGLHPMALHAVSGCVRLLVIHGARYRYVDRYETWVQYRSRSLPRRVDLSPLAEELSSVDDVRWEATAPDVLTPELAPAAGATSARPAADVEQAVVRHLRTAPPTFDPFSVA